MMSSTDPRVEAPRNIGCGVIMAVLAFVLLWGVGTWAHQTVTGTTDTDKIERAWDSMTAVERTALCAPVIEDPGFRGTAKGLAYVVGDPDISEWDAHTFLLDACLGPA